MQSFRRCCIAFVVICSVQFFTLPIANAYTVNTNSTSLSGLWWNPTESGWGVSITQQGPIIFVAWYAYTPTGAPIWYVISNCAVFNDACSGDIYQVTGGTSPTVAWNGANKVTTKVGTGSVTFSDVNTGVFRYTLNGIDSTRNIIRQVFATGTTPPANDYTALWWNPAESGWGISLTQQFNTIFAAWFAYDASANPIWYVATNCAVSGSGCSGDLYQVSGGSWPGVAWAGTPLAFAKVGAISFNFAGTGNTTTGTMNYSINGVSATRTISKQIFFVVRLAPEAPINAVATAGNGTIAVSFTAPTPNAGAEVSGYTVTCTGAGVSLVATGTTSPITVTGLTNGTAYTCTVTANSADGTSVASPAVSATPSAAVAFTLTSAAGINGGAMAADYTCDGMGSTVPLAWSNPPAGTREFALLMTTLPGDGTIKWNWVLYDIPSTTTALARDNFGTGLPGVGSDGPIVGYQPPCSQGPGAKNYTFTLYALSGSPVLPTASNQAVTGAALTAAISSLTLGTASLSLSFTRTTQTGSSAACVLVRNSTSASTTGNASVGCDANFAYLGANGLATHLMMNGILATNLQVPLAQNFFGTNAWKIPLAPAIAATTTSAVDGPIGIAINGVPIFNPCKQGGCQNGDTKVLGELDVCNGHAGRADDYHYHAAPTCMMAGKPASYWDTHPIGWALDGFAIFGYNNADGTVATRDNICGGNTLPVQNAPSGYSYHVTESSPYVLSCFRGSPGPDLANQGAKYSPLRQPPVTPFAVSNMTLTTDPADSYQVLQFTSSLNFRTTETGTDSYANTPGTYKIRYKRVTGSALATLLALAQNRNKTACWNFQFTAASGIESQPAISYCR